MNTKIITIALALTSLVASAQKMNERSVSPFNAIDISGVANVYYTDSDTLSLRIAGDEKEAEKVKTIFEKGTLYIEMKGGNENNVIVFVSNTLLNSISCNGVGKFRSVGTLKEDSLSILTGGAAQINATVTAKKIMVNGGGAGNIHLSGTVDQLNVVQGGASVLKAYDLKCRTVNVEASGASTSKVYADEKVNANASGASNIKIKGDAKDVSAEASSASSITRILENGEGSKGNGDSTTINWGRKKVIIIDGNEKQKKKHTYTTDFDHWAGFSLGVNGLLTPSAGTKMDKPYGYLDLNYSRCINVQLNLGQKNFHLYKNYVNLVTGFGFEWRRYMLDHKTTLNPDSSFAWGKIDSTNTFNYNKNLFKSTMIQVPLLLEFNTSKKPNKSFHIAFGAIGQFMINAKTKQILEKNGDSFTKIHKDTYNMVPWNLKAHASIGYSSFTVFAEYNLTPLFEKGNGPQLYPFVAGVRLISF